MMKKWFYHIAVILMFNTCFAASNGAITESISTNELKDFNHYPPRVQKLISQALTLATQHLTYTYGSADPKNGGMDCSGTIYYLLANSKLKDVPRDSEQLYQWVKKEGTLHPVTKNDFNSAEFSKLKPGDLLFWSGTYATNKSISHVMLYLGKNKQNQPLMVGASDGRTYQGKRMWGVSIYDFKLPNDASSSHFLGYSCIPNITC